MADEVITLDDIFDKEGEYGVLDLFKLDGGLEILPSDEISRLVSICLDPKYPEDEKKAAANLILISHKKTALKYAFFYANRFGLYGDLNDLIQVGLLGIYTGIFKYDQKKANFSTYANNRAKGYIFNKCKQILRRKEEDIEDYDFVGEEDVLNWDIVEAVEIINKFARGLNQRQQQVMFYWLYNLSHEEIRRIIAPNGTTSIITNFKKTLRDRAEQWELD